MSNAPISPVTYRDYGALKISSDYQLEMILKRIPVQYLQPEDWKEPVNTYEDWKYPYVDATPSELRSVKLGKLFWTELDWRVLTNSRTTNEFDDRFFSRLIELEKFRLYSRAMELRKIKYNKIEEEEQIVTLSASSVSYSSFCRHPLEDLEKGVNVIDHVDDGQILLDP